MYEAIGSEGANIAEGYSRGSQKDRSRFYEYALGSARETRDWYFKARHVLTDVVDDRLRLQARIIQLLLVMLPQQRGYAVREETAEYEVAWDDERGLAPDMTHDE